MLINITINKRRAKLAEKAVIICGNSDYTVNLNFDAEWSQHKVKTARVVYNGQYTDVVFEGNSFTLPTIINAKGVFIGVFAGDLHTTTPAYIGCEKSILCDNGIPVEPTPDVYAQIMQMINAKSAKIGEVTLLASKWVGEDNLYSQVVDIEGVTEYSQVDLTPNVHQLAIFYNKDITFVTENEDGIVTVYVIGQKPENDYTIQVTITEVDI